MVSAEMRIPRRKGIVVGRRSCVENDIADSPCLQWKHRGGGVVAEVSARKLAACLWRLSAATSGGGSVRWQFDRLRFEFCSSMPFPKFATEGVTKWDYCNSRTWEDASYFRSKVKLASSAYARDAELFNARKQVNKLEAQEWQSRIKKTEHQKMFSVIKNFADSVKRERKSCKKMDTMNSKLLCDIAEAKLSARWFIQSIEKEKKAREELEDVCQKLAKEIKGKKAEIGALRNQWKRIQDEVEEERKMLQIAEVWREEQVQMKLADAKLILEDKHAEINNKIADVKAFLRRLQLTGDVKAIKAKVLKQDFDSGSIQGVRNFTCRLTKSDTKTSADESRNLLCDVLKQRS